MPKAPMNSFLLLRREACTAAEENARRLQVAEPLTRRELLEPGGTGTMKTEATKSEVFWMKHPTTGNWIPETHFSDVDVADLREKFISKNPNKKH